MKRIQSYSGSRLSATAIVCLLFCVFIMGHAQEPINFQFSDVSLQHAIDFLIDTYHLPIAYQDNQIRGISVTAECSNGSVRDALDALLSRTPLHWQKIGAQFVVSEQSAGSRSTNQKKGIITGTVTDLATGLPLLDANVVVEDTPYGAATNSAGVFAIRGLPEGLYDVRFSFVGYRSVIKKNIRVQQHQDTQVSAALRTEVYGGNEVAVSKEKAAAPLPEVLKHGLALYETGEYDAAINEIKEVIKQNDKLPQAHHLLAKVYLAKGTIRHRRMARESAQKAISLDPETAEYQITLADILLAQTFKENSQHYLEKILERFPDNKNALYALAKIYQESAERLHNLVVADQAALFDEHFISYLGPVGYSINGEAGDWFEPSMSEGFFELPFEEIFDRPGFGRVERSLERIFDASEGAEEILTPIDILFEEEPILDYDNLTRYNANAMRDEARPPIFFEKFYRKELEKAWNTYERLHSTEPHYEDSDQSRALLAYLSGDWERMMELARDFVEKFPDDRNSYLLLGLAHQRAGDYSEAVKAFSIFEEQLTPDEKSLFERFDKFLSEKFQENMEKMPAWEQAEFTEKFWRSRDPRFLTEYNERKMEHFARIAEANILFSKPSKNLEGWKSDRGLIWVRYGAPILRLKNRTALGILRTLRREDRAATIAGDPLYEWWYYDKFTLMFSEWPLNTGNVAFVNTRSISFSKIAESVQKKYPDLFKMVIQGVEIGIPHYVANFRGKDNKTLVEVCYGVPLGYLTYKKQAEEYEGIAKQGIFLFDKDWDETVKDVFNARYPVSQPYDTSSSEIFSVINRMQISPGPYNLVVEISDEPSGNFGAIRQAIDVEQFTYDSLQLSDILMATDITVPESTEPLNIENLKYTPNVPRFYEKPHTLFLYFEIYNLWARGGEDTRFQIEYTVRYKESLKGKIQTVKRSIGRLFRFAEKRHELATTVEYSGKNAQENLYLEIDPADLESGAYQLSLKVTDLIAEETVEKQTEFLLLD